MLRRLIEMRRLARRRALAHTLLGAWMAATLGWSGPVLAADIKVLTAGAYKQVLLELAPGFEQRSGHRLVVDNDTAGGLVRRVNGGEAFDLLILTAGPLGELARGGRVAADGPGAPQALAKVGIGVAVRPGTPLPDLRSVASFREALLAARGIATVDPAAGGTSGIHLWKQFEAWGIAAQLRPKAALVPGGLSATKLLSGEAEIAIQQMSELVAVPGVRIVGMVPDEIQVFTTYSGALSSRAAQAEAALALLRHLSGAEARAVLPGKGMLAP